MKKHSLYLSGSGFAIAQKCPASLTIEFSKKLMADGKEAADGTDAHEEIAGNIESMRKYLPAKVPGLVEHIEERLSVKTGVFNLSGGPDYYAYNLREGVLYVVDWKTGPAGIDHLGADQIEFYAFLALLSMTPAARKQIEDVRLSLVSPRLNSQKRFGRPAAVLIEDIQEKLKLIERAVGRGQKPQPGEQCRWCNKRFVCVELRNELKRFADPQTFGTDGHRKEALQKITAEDLKTLSIAAAAIADIRKYVSELVENGPGIPGVRVEVQNAARFFAEGVDAALIAKALGVRPVQIMEQNLRTPAQLEKDGFDTTKVAEYMVISQRKTLKVEAPKKQTETQTTQKTQKGKKGKK